jgi:leucyl aminopeptidase
MEYSIKSGSPEKQRASCIVVGIFSNKRLSTAAKAIDKASDGYISNLMRRGDFNADLGENLMLFGVPNLISDRILLVGCGKERDFDANAFDKVIRQSTTTLQQSGATEVVTYLTELALKKYEVDWKIRRAILITETALYNFHKLKSKKKDTRRPLKRLILSVPTRRDLAIGEQAIREGMAIADGVRLTKDLANLPGNICKPEYLAEQARVLEKTYDQIKTTVLNEKDMDKLGMGAFLAVGRGSVNPPRLITMEYSGGGKKEKPIVLVGKGITFDSGGISIKPSAGMDEMKYDMGGAATVFGVIRACREMQLPINVVGVVAAAENMPDGNASRPGDVVTTMSGQTVEILNTDAEGRLVLCDTLTYADKFNPDVVIDMATLTGACIVALGHHASGLMSNHSPLAHDLLNAGKASFDRAWELPLWDDYQEQLDSNFADIANIGGRSAGTITAGCFLSRFTKKYRWAHLDIAGTAWVSGKEKGATGRPVPLIMQYLLEKAAVKKK